MLPIKRKQKIKNIISIKKSVTVTELTKLFDVTDETIRRDLQQLEQENFLTRTYGGAYISDGVENDVDINIREHIYTEGKDILSNTCYKHIQNGDSIFLDASTTSLFIAGKIKDIQATVTTNSLKIANVLSEQSNKSILLLGGNLAPSSMSFLGKVTETTLANYFFDSCFISCRALNMKNGITDSNELQAEIRKMALNHSNKKFLVADYTKFDRIAFTKISTFENIDTIIVDKKLSSDWHDFLKTKNIQLLECESDV